MYKIVFNKASVKAVFLLMALLFIPTISAQTLTSSSTDFTYGDLKITPQITLNQDIDDKTYLLETSGNSFYLKLLDDKKTINLPEFYWKLNFNPEENIEQSCSADNQFIKSCIGKRFDDSDFLSKNKIDKREILVKDNKGIFYTIANWLLHIVGMDTIPEHDYYIKYSGLITDLDPSLIEIITTTTSGTYNRTEATSLGVRNTAPILYLDFNEPSEQPINTKYFTQNFGENIIDKSIYNTETKIDGNSNQTIWMQTGKSGTGLVFDGTDDYLQLGQLNDYKVKNRTISFWAKPINHTTTAMTFTAGSANYYVGFSTNGRMIMSYSNNATNQVTAYSPTGSVIPNEWHHYTYYINDYNGTGVIRKMYIDGVSVLDDNSTNGTSGAYGSTFRIGTYQGTSTFYNGTLDEMQFYNCSLNETEIISINNSVSYEARCPDTSTGLVSWWRFNDTDYKNMTDDKNIRNGSLTNYEAKSPKYNSTGGYDGSGAYEFDGVDDYIAMPSSSSIGISKEFTVTGWFESNNINAQDNNIWSHSTSSSDRIGIMLESGILRGFYYNGSNYIGDTATVTANNTWYFFTYSFKNGVHNLTLNGIEGTGTTTDSLQATVKQVIGARADGTLPFNGTIDDIRVYNYRLNIDEIRNLYNGSIGNSSFSSKYNRQGDYVSGVFYNATSSYWLVNLSIADTGSSRSGIVNSDNTINIRNSNLVGYWALDGNYLDSLSRNNGVPTGTINSTGISSKAIGFDGIDDIINNSNSEMYNLSANNITISAWIRTTANVGSSGRRIVSKGEQSTNYGYIFAIGETTDLFQFGSSAGNMKASFNLNDGKWHHLLATSNGTIASSVSMYIDGIAQSGLVETGTYQEFEQTTQPLAIGGEYDDGVAENFYNGSIDEVLIYNISLSPSEITQLYKSGLSQHANTNITLQTRTANTYNVSDEGLVALYDFNNDNSSNVYDETGRNNGTYQNGSLSNSLSGIIGNGLYLDGDNDFVNISTENDLAITKNISISFWINLKASGQSAGIISKSDFINDYGDFYIVVNANKIRFAISENKGGVGPNGYDISANRWYHIVATYNGTATALWIDGQIYETNSSYTGDISNTYNVVRLGMYYAEGTRELNASIDEVRIYNRSLSPSEILDLYNLGSTHISDWSSWEDLGIVQDSVETQSNNQGKFMQFKTIYNTNLTLNSPYLISYNISSEYEDKLPVWDSIPNNKTTEYMFEEVYVNFSATDESGISAYFTNWSSNLTINSSGTMRNITSIAIGVYYINVSVNDTINNINWIIFRLNVSDTTPPSLTITSPTNITYYSTTIALNTLCTDTNGISAYLYSLDGASNISFTPNITIATVGYEVYHTLDISCNDTFNNWAWEYRKFYIGNYPSTNGSSVPYQLTTCPYKKYGYYNEKLPILQGECI